MDNRTLTEEENYEAYCPKCGLRYTTTDKPEVDDPDRLCPKCFDEFDGMTLEQLQHGF